MRWDYKPSFRLCENCLNHKRRLFRPPFDMYVRHIDIKTARTNSLAGIGSFREAGRLRRPGPAGTPRRDG